jgi:hypothetical protein
MLNFINKHNHQENFNIYDLKLSNLMIIMNKNINNISELILIFFSFDNLFKYRNIFGTQEDNYHLNNHQIYQQSLYF